MLKIELKEAIKILTDEILKYPIESMYYEAFYMAREALINQQLYFIKDCSDELIIDDGLDD